MTTPKRQRLDVEQRRDAILKAAAEQFSDGYAGVSVAQVGAAAGASNALVFHYFGSKAGLYCALVERWLEELWAAQVAADEELAVGVPARDRVRASLLVYLDFVARDAAAWARPFTGAEEPAEAQALRTEARRRYVAALRDLLELGDGWARHEYALWGYFGFLDMACLRWVEAGCPGDQRHPLAEAALGALEGALGDWGHARK